MVKLADLDKEAEKQEDEIEGAQKDYKTRTKMDKSKALLASKLVSMILWE